MTRHSTPTVSTSQLESYQRDGGVVLRDAIDAEWLASLEAAIERDIQHPGPFYHGYTPQNGHGKFHGNVRLWEHDAVFRDYCLHSPLPDLAQQFFASTKVNLLYDQLFVKEPETLNRTRWHNDQPYWPIRGWQVISFWVALDPITIENGALEFVRGSHLWNRWFQPERFGETSGHGDYERNPDYEPMPDIEAMRDDYDIVSWDLAPGDVYVFHGLTVHGAGGNQRHDVRRRGYTVRYTGDDVVYDIRPGSNANLRHPTLSDGEALDSDQYPLVKT